VKEFNLQDWGFTRESKLVILTGAGISAESGIQTFRDSDGLWNNHSIEDVCTPGGYTRNRQLVLDWKQIILNYDKSLVQRYSWLQWQPYI